MKSDDQEKKEKGSVYTDRSKARQVLVEMLYEWNFCQDSMDELFQNRVRGLNSIDLTYLKQVFFELGSQLDEIDALVSPVLDRDISKLGIIELSVLRLATYELKHMLEVPYKVVLDEAIELTRLYGSQDSYKYVNAVLQKLITPLRQHESSGQ